MPDETLSEEGLDRLEAQLEQTPAFLGRPALLSLVKEVRKLREEVRRLREQARSRTS